MNRVLRRPMFRIGGSAGTGITSGLDTPRKQYSDGTDPFDRALKTTERATQDLDKFRVQQTGMMPGALPGFLTQFGLNLLSTPPRGNIFSTAAVAAREPFQTFQAAQLAERERKADLAEDIFSGALASEYDLLAAEKKSGADSRKTAEVEADIIRTAQNNIFAARDTLKKEGITAEERLAAERKIKVNQNVLEKELGAPAEYAAIISSEELFNSYKSSYVEKENNRRLEEYKNKNADATAEEIAENVTLIDEDSPEASDFTIAELRKTYYFADGGRVGLKLGTPKMMESVSKTERETGEVQDLSYTELRARLPQEISNDIVQLLANSKQALLDFANIQTPEDIASFNQQYEVNLSLPQGA
jgi:hypothetical protein